MFITKCDKCKKEIKKGEKAISAGFGGFMCCYSFCEKCGKPIHMFLTKNKFKNGYDTGESAKNPKKRGVSLGG